MDWFRSKELKTQLQSINQWVQTTKTSKYTFNYKSNVHVPASIWNDITVKDWLKQHLPLQSEIDFASALIQAPITDIPQLKQRQRILQSFKTPHQELLSPNIEGDIQWFLSSPVIEKNYLFKLLFPNSWYLRWVKLQPELLSIYQLYNTYFTTASSLFYPLSILFGPFWIMRYKMGFPLDFKDYIKMIFKLISLFKNDLKHLAGFFAYAGFYIYSLIQQVDLTLQLHNLRSILLQKIKSICSFIQKVKRVAPGAWWQPFDPFTLQALEIKPTLFWVYRLLTQPELQDRLFAYFKVAVIHDTCIHLCRLNYTVVGYGHSTVFYHMSNPMLGLSQVANPLSLKQNLIVSGPNAGGKTTYIKSLLWNILLSQSLGIAYCSKGVLKPYDAILHHHRVTDITGDQSLFQAEMAKIKETLTCLDKYSSIIYFMDEPLHSTHPIDGAAMLKSILYYLGTFEKCTVVITSHYFSIQTVPGYTNVSVKAVLAPEKIHFDYKIYPGGSKQTVGIELLKQGDFPSFILESAVKLKNKIYAGTINV